MHGVYVSVREVNRLYSGIGAQGYESWVGLALVVQVKWLSIKERLGLLVS